MNKKKGREKGREQGTPNQRAEKEETTHKPIRGGKRVVEEALIALARLWPEKPDAKWDGER